MHTNNMQRGKNLQAAAAAAAVLQPLLSTILAKASRTKTTHHINQVLDLLITQEITEPVGLGPLRMWVCPRGAASGSASAQPRFAR